ncbi:MAG: dUTP diphosphatase [Deltaproteobacteria bacterium]|nr:MAG: dUTP diphosphatase [Deltaproteobacteria bacterium]
MVKEIMFVWLDKQAERDFALPDYKTKGSSGMDVQIAIASELVLPLGEIRLLPTGFALAVPQGYEMQIRPRSGLAIKHGITLINSPGTIDADYRGEIKIGLINLGKKPYLLRRGDRVAQMVLAPITKARLTLTDTLDKTERGSGGFGHTGMR